MDVDLLLGGESYQWLAEIAPVGAYFVPRTVNLKGYDQPVSAWGTKFTELEKFVETLPV